MSRGRMTADDARELCDLHGIDRRDGAPDWHRMNTDQKERVLAAADARGYRKPRNANGSRGRCFAEYLARAINTKGVTNG